MCVTQTEASKVAAVCLGLQSAVPLPKDAHAEPLRQPLDGMVDIHAVAQVSGLQVILGTVLYHQYHLQSAVIRLWNPTVQKFVHDY